MIVHIEMGSVPLVGHEPTRRVVYHAWSEGRDDDSASVMDVNHAAQIVARICKDCSPVVSGRPNEDGYRGEFQVLIRVERTHKRISHYSAAYGRLYEHCAVCVAEQGMSIYRTIKRVLRESRDSLRERKRAARERREEVCVVGTSCRQ